MAASHLEGRAFERDHDGSRTPFVRAPQSRHGGDTGGAFAYGRQYARPGLSLRDRYLATIAALTAQGGQTGPQLRINISGGRKAGLSREEIAEVIWQMSLYGGFPSAINALNTATEVFELEGQASD